MIKGNIFSLPLTISAIVILVIAGIYFSLILPQKNPISPPSTPSDPSQPITKPDEPSTISLQELKIAPEKIVIDDNEYMLETNLWRDFMPITPPGGKPLIALIKVKSHGNADISSRINATRLWVINGEEIWETEFSNEKPPNADENTLEKISRNGPKWATSIKVDVVVRVKDLKSNKEYLLKASNQEIGRTL